MPWDMTSTLMSVPSFLPVPPFARVAQARADCRYRIQKARNFLCRADVLDVHGEKFCEE